MSVRIYVVYDEETERDIYQQLVDLARREPIFEVAGGSARGPESPQWQRHAEGSIAAADQVIVLCGNHTDESHPICEELRIAHELGKPVTLLWSRREVMCKKPLGAGANESIFSWTPSVLREQIALHQRLAEKPAIPASLKRPSPPAPKR